MPLSAGVKEQKEATPKKVYTQEDVNRLGNKAHKSGYTKAVRDLGFDDFEAANNALKVYIDYHLSSVHFLGPTCRRRCCQLPAK